VSDIYLQNEPWNCNRGAVHCWYTNSGKLAQKCQERLRKTDVERNSGKRRGDKCTKKKAKGKKKQGTA
jgi:hypothetical protein